VPRLISDILHDNHNPELKLHITGHVTTATVEEWLRGFELQDCAMDGLAVRTVLKPETTYRAATTIGVVTGLLVRSSRCCVILG
jgi:hypothetical protein